MGCEGSAAQHMDSSTVSPGMGVNNRQSRSDYGIGPSKLRVLPEG